MYTLQSKFRYKLYEGRKFSTKLATFCRRVVNIEIETPFELAGRRDGRGGEKKLNMLQHVEKRALEELNPTFSLVFVVFETSKS